MTYDELELEAVLLEVLENRGNFESLEYMTQFSPINKKRFVSLYTV